MTELIIPLDDNKVAKIYRYIGTNGEYYQYNNIYYDINFPIEWILHKPDIHPFGPENCQECFKKGFYNGVFIGYCVNCAEKVHFCRGNGMIEQGKECIKEDINSMWNIYMQTVDLHDIGDILLNDKYICKLYDLNNK